MSKQFVMGNEAMGLAAVAAGVRCVAGYPGTPSTEVLETVAKNNPGDIHVEKNNTLCPSKGKWSIDIQ